MLSLTGLPIPSFYLTSSSLMFYGNFPPLCPSIPPSWGCTASAWAAALRSVYSCGELTRENCLQHRSERHHVLLPVRRLHPSLFPWLCGLIRSAAEPGTLWIPASQTEAGPLRTAPLAVVGLALMWSGGLLSKAGSGQASQPGSAALVRCHGPTGFARWFLADLVNMDGMMI